MPNLLPDEDSDIREEVKKVIQEPDRWLQSPSSILGGLAPAELIGTPDEMLLRELVRSLKHGVIS